MFAAAAIVANAVYETAIRIAQWLATKVFIIAIMAIVLPWVLRGFFVWGFNWLAIYGRDIVEYLITAINGQVAAAGMNINIDLVGPGGYIAYMVGLPEYASIIFTGWGLYWVIAILAKSSRIV